MRLPDDSQRILIAGHSGSGKSTEALHQLSQRSIAEKPWIALDFKGGDLLAKIPVTATASIFDPPPTDPGLYVVKCSTTECEKRGRLESYLLEVLNRGQTGVLVDEGYVVGQHNRGLRALLTQGRSKGCPVIFVTQRPVYIDAFALSEADFIQVFMLVHPEDQDRVQKFVPPGKMDFAELSEAGEYHSFFYDVKTREVELLGPCPPFESIYDRILTRLPHYVEHDDKDQPIDRKRVKL